MSLNTNSKNREWDAGYEIISLKNSRGRNVTVWWGKRTEEEAWWEDHAKPLWTGKGSRPGTYTTLPSPNTAPWNKYLILSWFLILKREFTQTPQGNRKLGQGKSQCLGPTPNVSLKSYQIRFTFTASLMPSMT